MAHQSENKRKPVIELSRNAPIVYEISRSENEQPKGAFFSLGSYRGYSLYIYVYIHFQYFPAEKLIVHVNGYSFRLGISYGNTSCHSMFSCENISFVHFVNSSLFMYYVHSPCLQRKPQTCKGLKCFALKNDHNLPAMSAEPI